MVVNRGKPLQESEKAGSTPPGLTLPAPSFMNLGAGDIPPRSIAASSRSCKSGSRRHPPE